MWNDKDIALLKEKNISVEKIDNQINIFKKGIKYMDILKPATIGDGMLKFSEDELQLKIRKYNYDYLFKAIIKFVPASGAASRMFKDLFEFQSAPDKEAILKKENSVSAFFQGIKKFAFFNELRNSPPLKHIDFDQKDFTVEECLLILDELLGSEGMNYGNLPKGLLKFHKTVSGAKTPVQEHLVEGALYASSGDDVKLHLTVSPEHMEAFKIHVNEIIPLLEAQFEMKFEIEFSVQKTSTDTIAVDPNNQPFRNNDGSLLFRPGGHGALIENLNELDADIIFIKNIDNVTPDKFKQTTIDYKKALAGLLIEYQEIIFSYLKKLEEGSTLPNDYITEIEDFLERKLYIIPPTNYKNLPISGKIDYLKVKLNRPIRVCGMVKNEGEPGGGPFWTKNLDGSIALQIVETSQINMKDPSKVEIVNKSTHFNPVDLVCATKDFKGNKFNLTEYIDPDTFFISEKSKDGKQLKALELPGLWNGTMANWNTLFVEVDIATFTPVKTINDLLRPEHQ